MGRFLLSINEGIALKIPRAATSHPMRVRTSKYKGKDLTLRLITIVAAAIAEWNVIWGLLYSKLLASVALIVIFAVSHRQQQLATQALILTASVYGCAALVSVCEALR
jgi:hypothetical protein